MVRSASSRVSNHEALILASSFETRRFSAPFATASRSLGLLGRAPLLRMRHRTG
jgi:hypothetical protein